MDDIKIDDVCLIFAWRSGLVGLGAVRFNENASQSWVFNLVTILGMFSPRNGSSLLAFICTCVLQSLGTKLVEATTLLHKALLDLSIQLFQISFS